MTKSVALPFEDHDNTLTPHVVDALEAGLCTSARDPDNRDMIILTFEHDADADAFAALFADQGEDVLLLDSPYVEPVIEVLNPVVDPDPVYVPAEELVEAVVEPDAPAE